MGLTRDLATVARGWRWGHQPLVPRSVEAPAPVTPARDLAWARGPAASQARALILRFGLAPLLHAEVNVSVHGREALDGLRPPVVFVANHTSHLDAPLILTALPSRWQKRTAVGAAADYFFDAWWRAQTTALVFNAFPVERSGALRSVGVARDLLAQRWNLLVFPEGTRSHDGWMGDFKRGAAMLAAYSGVPIVPVALHGAFRAMPRGRAWPLPGRPAVSIRFGAPVVPTDGERTAELNERVRSALARALHEEDATWWEAQRAAAAEATSDPSGPPATRWRRVWDATRPPPPPRRAWPRSPRG
ncbi:MAG: 1-acyl-sn-glycerol-3-phosphate acyltransferase [Actinomycetota bacterium]|nr:1-acyl-sn-glycerol-3-phosphate acyltransferase [Actinomycetota bacterium]